MSQYHRPLFIEAAVANEQAIAKSIAAWKQMARLHSTREPEPSETPAFVQICDNCPTIEYCCSFYTDAALHCTCAQCSRYLSIWQQPSRIGSGLCDDCYDAQAGRQSRPPTLRERGNLISTHEDGVLIVSARRGAPRLPGPDDSDGDPDCYCGSVCHCGDGPEEGAYYDEFDRPYLPEAA